MPTIAPSACFEYLDCDACEDRDDDLVSLTLTFTGSDVVSHSQDDRVTVTGSTIGFNAVNIEVYDDDGSVAQSFTNVAVGESFTLLVSAFDGKFPTSLVVGFFDPAITRDIYADEAYLPPSFAPTAAPTIMPTTAQMRNDTESHKDNSNTCTSSNALACSEFHMSCSRPIFASDQYGPIQVTNFLLESGRTVSTCQVTTCTPTAPPATAAPTPCDSVCDACEDGDKLSSLTLSFAGTETIFSDQPDDKVSVTGTATGLDVVDIEISDKDGNLLRSYNNVPRGSVDLIVFASDFSGGKFSSEMTVAIFDPATFKKASTGGGGTGSGVCDGAVACVLFHTSCSHPLRVADQFGPIQIHSFVSDSGRTPASCLSTCAPVSAAPIAPTAPTQPTQAPTSAPSVCISESCDACEDGAKLSSLTVVLDGTEGIVSEQDSDKITVTGSAVGFDTVDIEIADKDGNVLRSFSDVSRSTSLLTIFASDFSDGKFSSEIFIAIFDPTTFKKSNNDNAAPSFCDDTLACVRFHTSCSHPLQVNDQYGPIRIQNFLSDSGRTSADCAATCPPSVAREIERTAHPTQAPTAAPVPDSVRILSFPESLDAHTEDHPLVVQYIVRNPGTLALNVRLRQVQNNSEDPLIGRATVAVDGAQGQVALNVNVANMVPLPPDAMYWLSVYITPAGSTAWSQRLVSDTLSNIGVGTTVHIFSVPSTIDAFDGVLPVEFSYNVQSSSQVQIRFILSRDVDSVEVGRHTVPVLSIQGKKTLNFTASSAFLPLSMDTSYHLSALAFQEDATIPSNQLATDTVTGIEVTSGIKLTQWPAELDAGATEFVVSLQFSIDSPSQEIYLGAVLTEETSGLVVAEFEELISEQNRHRRSQQLSTSRTIGIPGGLKPASASTTYALNIFVYIVNSEGDTIQLASQVVDSISVNPDSIVDVAHRDSSSGSANALGSGGTRIAVAMAVTVAILVGILALAVILLHRRREQRERLTVLPNSESQADSTPAHHPMMKRGDEYSWDDTLASLRSPARRGVPSPSQKTTKIPSEAQRAPQAFLTARKTGLLSRITDESVWDWDAGTIASADMWESSPQEANTAQPQRGFAELIGDRLMAGGDVMNFSMGDYMDSGPQQQDTRFSPR